MTARDAGPSLAPTSAWAGNPQPSHPAPPEPLCGGSKIPAGRARARLEPDPLPIPLHRTVLASKQRRQRLRGARKSVTSSTFSLPTTQDSELVFGCVRQGKGDELDAFGILAGRTGWLIRNKAGAAPPCMGATHSG